MSASRNLQQWCSRQCEGYPGILIYDLSSSFRDGLAFCALIHRHRPDLIDFDSLSKENVFENNRLAFEVAERELGIPALLDPEDMVSMKVPDRLSIMTYLSQYYNHFRNSSPVGKPQLKETSESPSKEPSGGSLPQGSPNAQTSLIRSSISSTCALCQQHVHLVQRYLVEGKLYHRQCFRCKECSSTLVPGAYRPGTDAGTLVCTHHCHRPPTSSPESEEDGTKQKAVQTPPKPFVPEKPASSNKPPTELHPDPFPNMRPVPAPRRTSDVAPQPLPRSRAAAESSPVRPTSLINGEQQSPAPPIPKPRSRQRSSEREDEEKQKKNPPWLSLVPATEPKRRAAPPPPPLAQKPELGDEKSQKSLNDTEKQSLSSKPTAYNPFEDEEEEAETSSLKPGHPWYGITPTSSPKSRKRLAPKAPNASPLAHHSNLVSRLSHSEPPSGSPSPALSTESLPTDASTKGQDPESVPKSSSEPTIHSPNKPEPSDRDTTTYLSTGVPSTSTNTSLSSSSELANTNEAQESPSPEMPLSPSRPAPQVPTISIPSTVASDSTPPEKKPLAKQICKQNPFNRKSSPATSPINKRNQKGPKPSRPPAPGHGFPLIKRKVQADDYIPEDEIQMEMETIELRLDELERRGVELEHRLRKLENESDEDSLLVDWFKLIQEKHTLVRRESELVYTTKQQSLEQRQADVEYELRCLLNKPEKDWLEEDKEREQVLMQELVTLIEQRNAIVKCLDEDRQREKEEDKIIEAMILKKDFHTDPQKKKKGKFKPIKVLKLLSPKQEPKVKSPKDKNKVQSDGTKR
ncbi:hypothetical protein XENTR_v10012503 [Xenopus tropicalis]|nr:MICAL-like protein 1 [Xenopus tropicalis]XP_031756945.1 MICAL-like protein 1 [Xenopus tropicalis]KAE8611556.1 hypothetical protein XENTR_v10012503 [Xenopus tropicalis]KAE8611557.1 hypothetical protein XENTR_v10012503 [Xenopus tropicalis]KAE8611558.1 hypothetical protein XENTR_v10012503 [Xenopus tropicalis]|eukprot:XP_002934280.2 PREDICTED: MICAL-like protein 1 isoform X1 [Xenopus tropicalis]